MKFLNLIATTIVITVVLAELYFLLIRPLGVWESFFQIRSVVDSHDVTPQPLNLFFSQEPPFGEDIFYFQGDLPQSSQEKFGLGVVDKTYFPYRKNGEIHPPKKYEVEKNYSKKDIEKMKVALKVAYRYADINKAIEDGYRIESVPYYPRGMGIHVFNLDYVLDDEISMERPEFLNYIKNRETGSFQLVQFGFIVKRDIPYSSYKIFEKEDALGHYHVGNICLFADDVYVNHLILDSNRRYGVHIFNETGDLLTEKISEEECKEGLGGKVLGPSIWMMHFAVNMYNELGMFSDYFPYVDYLSANAISHSFLGKKLEN